MKNRYVLLLFGVAGAALAGIYGIAQQEGYLAADMPGMTLQLKGGLGSHGTLCSGPTPLAVAARTYRPVSLELMRKQDGDTWQMWSRGPWGTLDRIRVDRGRTTAVKLGPPLIVKPQVDVFQGQVFVGLRILGQAGEQYTNLICRNDRRIEVPKVKIVDGEGNVLIAGNFQYG